MVPVSHSKTNSIVLWIILGFLFFLPYMGAFRTLCGVWFNNPEFSFGILIPIIVVFLIWSRRGRIQGAEKSVWQPGLGFVLAGCGLQVLGSMSGTLLLSGFAFAITVMGITGFLWGSHQLRIVAAPLAMLVLMVPLPSYLVGELSWRLQSFESTISGKALAFLGVPVFQDGTLLRIPNYVLEVKQACSGTRSIFALLALACVLGLSLERKNWIRILLVAAAPVLAVGTNVIRIVGTGLIARKWGGAAADEAIHETWGLLVFMVAVLGLLGFQRLLRWATNEYA